MEISQRIDRCLRRPPTEDQVANDAEAIDFTSLGMIVLDEIIYPTKSYHDILGGSGTYAILGARIFRSPTSSSTIGWTIRASSDLPKPSRETLEAWLCTFDFKSEPGARITRGRLQYFDEYGDKSFEYLTPILQVRPSDLSPTKTLGARALHILASPAELTEQLDTLMRLRAESKIHSNRPYVIWEPRPSSCTPELIKEFFTAVSLVDVVSPNHHEFARLFGDAPSGAAKDSSLDKDAMERHAAKVLNSGVGPYKAGAVVIRAESEGCLVVSKGVQPTWLPAFYRSMPLEHIHSATEEVRELYDNKGDGNEIVDPTGAGNAFLGAFAIGFLDTKNLVTAACYGNVGASFALEQIGMPKLSRNEDGEEYWNGTKAQDRLSRYRAGLEGYTR